MTDFLWTLVFIQIVLGAFDTYYHHELTELLAWRATQRRELFLHAVRDLVYAVLFMVLGWSAPHGGVAIALVAVMLGEIGITLWDFVEEDRTRKLPSSERVTHAVLTLNCGVVLTSLAPLFRHWMSLPTGIESAYYGLWSWACALASIGVGISGLRDLMAAFRAPRIGLGEAAHLASALKGRQTILITGGTGFIGRRLVPALVETGHDVIVLTRSRAHAADLPAPIRIVTSLDQIGSGERIDAIVNLAGEPLANGFWTRAKRLRILRSRLSVTREVFRLVRRLHWPPKVLVNGSAIGWYGLRGSEVLDETGDAAPCFSYEICARWERAALRVPCGRVVLLRIGLVLGAEGGMLARMLAPFEYGLGGPFGKGAHWMSWIHRDDMVRMIVHALATSTLHGPVNGTAPTPVRNKDFAKALGRALHRPALLPVPAAPLRLVLGDFAEELLLRGQRVVPSAAMASGFRFTYPDIDSALAAIVGCTHPAPEARHAKLGRAGRIVPPPLRVT